MAERPAFDALIAARAARKARAQLAGAPWFGLGMFGMVGWAVAVPTVLGALLGAWWDRRHPGPHSLTLALLVAGLTFGCANAWYWLARQNAAIHADTETAGDE